MDEIGFVLSVDTEEEWDWGGAFPERNFSVKNGANLGKFQKFCDGLGVRPTYFVDYAIANDPKSVSMLRPPSLENRCEVAAHLHPWCTPPFDEKVCYENSYLVNLPKHLIRKKLASITGKLEDVFGSRPTSFRAGRWAVNGMILRMLAESGYRIDSSIHPFYRDICFDYRKAPDIPYWPSFRDITLQGSQRQICEIPVTSGFNVRGGQFCQRLHELLSGKPFCIARILGILSRLNIFYKVQFSPELADTPQMISCAESCIRGGHRILHMYFHSSSLLPGGSPYVKNLKEERLFYAKIQDTVEYLVGKYNIDFYTLTESRKCYSYLEGDDK